MGVQVFRKSDYVLLDDCTLVQGNNASARLEALNTVVRGGRCIGEDTNLTGSIVVGVNGDINTPAEAVLIDGTYFTGGGIQIALGGVLRCQVVNTRHWNVVNLNGCAVKLDHYWHALHGYEAFDNSLSGVRMWNVRGGVKIGGTSTVHPVEGIPLGVWRTRIHDLRVLKGPNVNLAYGIQEIPNVPGGGHEYAYVYVKGSTKAYDLPQTSTSVRVHCREAA